jgi:uncharacterized protein (UPF0333 family)
MKRGQIALPYVLLISGVIIEIAIAGALVVYFLSTSTRGEKLNARASAAAYSGIQDAMKRISKNKENGTGKYCITIDADEVKIDVVQDTVTDPNNHIYTITATGEAADRVTEFSAVLAVAKTTGVLHVQSIEEQAISAVNQGYVCT